MPLLDSEAIILLYLNAVQFFYYYVSVSIKRDCPIIHFPKRRRFVQQTSILTAIQSVRRLKKSDSGRSEVKVPETILASNLIAAIDSCIKRASNATAVEHHGMAGNIREIFLSDLITPLLPEGFRAGTGKILDTSGRLSSQTDIVIYNKSRFSPLMFDEKTGIFPMESVYYAIEVKSTINATEIRDAITKAEILRSMTGGPINFVLFGFDTDVKSKESDLSRVQEYQAGNPFPYVNIYCSVGNGYCYHDRTKWHIFDATIRRAEVIGLLIGIMNTLVNTGVRAKNVDPGNYLAWWE